MKEGRSNLREGFFFFFATFPEKHFGQLVGVLNNMAENRIACLEKWLTSPDQCQCHCVKPLGFVFHGAVSVTLKLKLLSVFIRHKIINMRRGSFGSYFSKPYVGIYRT